MSNVLLSGTHNVDSCRCRALFALMTATVVFATEGADVCTWTRNTKKNVSTATEGKKIFTDKSYWVDESGQVGSGSPTANDVFVFTGTRVRQGYSGTFAGKLLQFGSAEESAEVVHDNGTTITFANDGLKLMRMNWYFNKRASSFKIAGPIRILDDATGSPVVFHVGQEQYGDSGATLSGALSGGPNAHLLFGPLPDVKYGTGAIVCATNATFEVSDISAYEGTIAVSSRFANVVQENGRFAQFGTYLKLGSATSSAKIRVGSNGVIGTCSATDVVTVGELSFASGAFLRVSGRESDMSSVGLIRASNGLSLSGKLPIYVNTIFRDRGELRMPVLSWPSTQSFAEDDFELVRGNDFHNLDMHFEVGEDNEVPGNTALFIVTYGFVIQTGSYSDEGNRDGVCPSSLTNSAAWWDKDVPHEGSAYRSNTRLRTLTDKGLDCVFPGVYYWQEAGKFVLACKSFTVPDFYVGSLFSDYTVAICSPELGASVGTIVADRFHFMRGTVALCWYKGHGGIFEGDIEGAATIELQGWSGTGYPEGVYALKGNNTNFTGRIVFNQQELRPAYCNFTHSQRLNVYDGRNLGGKMPDFDPRALTLTHYGQVYMNAEDVILAPGLNRGIYVLGCGRVSVPRDSKNSEIYWPVLLSGELWKEGPGSLLLGAEMRHEAEDGGALSDVPRANSNRVVVAQGTLKIAHADALAGAETVFSNGTELVIRYNATDDALRQCGIRNTTVDRPFALGDRMGGKLPLTLDVSALPVPSAPDAPKIGLFTVRDSAADTVAAMLPERIKLWKGYASKIVREHDEGAQTTTFSVSSQRMGLVLIVQ